LTDSWGHQMIDGVASMWCNVWGHSNPELIRAITQQAERLQHSSMFNMTHGPAEELAERLVEISPGMHRVMYSDNGSTAVEIALKMAVQYWSNSGQRDRNRIVSLEGGYHGDTLGAMSAGYVPEFFGSLGHYVPAGVAVPVPVRTDPRAPPQKEQMNSCLDRIDEELSRSDVAAIIMESGAQLAGGVRIYPKQFQREVSRLCRRNAVLLIVDEVATGFGRLGMMSPYHTLDSKPDIVTYGKMLTGGYLTMAATLATREVYDSFLGAYNEKRHLFHGHTYTGNPIAAAAAIKNLEMYQKYDLIRHVTRTAATLEEYKGRFSDIDIVGDVRCMGMLLGAELVSGRGDAAPICPATSINRIMYEAGKRRGVYLRTLGNIIMLVPPLAITKDELVMLLERTMQAVTDAKPALLACGPAQ